MTMNAYDRDLYACRPTPIAPRFVTKPARFVPGGGRVRNGRAAGDDYARGGRLV